MSCDVLADVVDDDLASAETQFSLTQIISDQRVSPSPKGSRAFFICAMPAYDNSDGRLRGRALQAARLRIWSNDPHCARCGKLVAYPGGFELDHKRAVSKQGGNDDDNLQVLCIELDQQGNKTGCHVDKTAQDLGRRERVAIGVDGWPVTG